MTQRESNLKKIRDACIVANPSLAALPNYPYNPDAAKAIVELEKLAQKTLWNDPIEQTASIMIERYRQQQQTDYVRMLESKYKGREPELADVLLAMHASDNAHDGYYSMGSDGAFYVVRYTYPDNEHCVITHDGLESWNLHENLSGQTDSTIEFISSLVA